MGSKWKIYAAVTLLLLGTVLVVRWAPWQSGAGPGCEQQQPHQEPPDRRGTKLARPGAGHPGGRGRFREGRGSPWPTCRSTA